MNFGPNNSSGGGRGRRRRNRRPPGGRPGGRKGGGGQGPRERDRHAGIYTAPMDHSYRAVLNGDGNRQGNNRGRPGRGGLPSYLPADPEPVPVAVNGDATTRIFAFVDDLFFLAKIQEIARKLSIKVEFIKTEKELAERMGQNGEEKPSLIIFDLNNAAIRPLAMIPKLKSKLKKGTSIIGFLSHVQGDLKVKAQEAGCDMVLPRSAFSQNLPQLLRRHGTTEADDQVQ
jgi:hypothetical protein